MRPRRSTFSLASRSIATRRGAGRQITFSSTDTAKPQTAARHRDASIKTSWNLLAREAACACYGRNVVDRAARQCFVSRICQFGLMGMDIVVPGGAPSKAVDERFVLPITANPDRQEQ